MSNIIIPIGGCQKYINDKYACVNCHLSDIKSCDIWAKQVNNFVEEDKRKYPYYWKCL